MSWLFVGHVGGPSSKFNILVGEGTCEGRIMERSDGVYLSKTDINRLYPTRAGSRIEYMCRIKYKYLGPNKGKDND